MQLVLKSFFPWLAINEATSEEPNKMAAPQYYQWAPGHIYMPEEGGNEIAT